MCDSEQTDGSGWRTLLSRLLHMAFRAVRHSSAQEATPKEHMLHSMKDIETCTISAIDGVLGTPKDFYFDDQAWVIRYLVVETAWVTRRRVLISPIALGRPHWSDKQLPVSLTLQQIENSPDIDMHKPVSRQQEMGYLDYYGYGAYWGGGGLWGAAISPDTLQAGLVLRKASEEIKHDRDDPHLRSSNAVMRYYVHATDGDIGHVQGFLLNEESWAIQYLIVNTSNWWLGHQVVIAPEWIDHVSWAESTVYLDLSREAVRNSPPYEPEAALEREHETSIHTHYGRKPYWPDEKH
jgi:hypothetical protein